MKDAAGDMDYEQAARLRDDIGALNRALEKSAVVLTDATGRSHVAVVPVRAFPLSAPQQWLSFCDNQGRELLIVEVPAPAVVPPMNGMENAELVSCDTWLKIAEPEPDRSSVTGTA